MKYFFKINIILFCILHWAQVQAQNGYFVPNKGQWDSNIRYKLDYSHGSAYVVEDGIVFNTFSHEVAEHMHKRSTLPFIGKAHAFKIQFKNSKFENFSAFDIKPFYLNYFIGKDAQKWQTNIYPSGQIICSNIYPGVDLQLIATETGLKYNIICSSILNLENVNMSYLGLDKIIAEENQLLLHTSLDTFRETIPASWLQNTNGTKTAIDIKYKLEGNNVKFYSNSVINSVNKAVVDPVLVFSTFSGSTADNFGCTATYDDLGNSYSGGTVFGIGFPATLGAYDLSFNFGGPDQGTGYGGARDVGILKYNATGTSLLWATYLGGGDNEQPHSMVADTDGSLYIMGTTRSPNFPVPTTAYDDWHNGEYDFFVSHLNANGNALLGSTFIGGTDDDGIGAKRTDNNINTFPLLYNYADEFRGEIILDSHGIYVCGTTFSFNFPNTNTNFPFAGAQDAVLFKLNKPLTALNWSLMFGGDQADIFYGIALSASKHIYAAGGTASNNLQSRYSVVNNTFAGGEADGIIAYFDKTTGQIKNARYYGTAAYDQIHFVQTDNSGRPYVYGQSEGFVPIVNAIYNQGQKGQFISRFNLDLSTVELSTNFGGTANIPNISPSAFLVDECERIFVSGWGGETNRSLADNTGSKINRNVGFTYGLPVTADAIQRNTDGSDFYVGIFSKELNSLLYGTFFGGISVGNNHADEHVDGGTSRFDKKGIIYQAVCAGCGRNGLFPTTANAYSRTMRSNNCNNAIFKIDFENLNKKPFMPDAFQQVVASKNIDISLAITDPDVFDPLAIKYSIINMGGITSSNPPIITFTPPSYTASGYTAGNFRLTWATKCENVNTDTAIIRVVIYDNGCPQQDSHVAIIKLLVTEPPLVIPPESVCLNFNRASNQLIITWDPINPDLDYFKLLELRMDKPDGTTETLVSQASPAGGTYSITMPTDPFTEDYCFYMVGINICDKMQFPTEKFCTIRELNKPINGVDLKYVTVVSDSFVHLEWYTSIEPDFKEFEIYRSLRNNSKDFKLLTRTKDTFYNDYTFNVDSQSYCYAIVVTDRCGHASSRTPEQCNMVLTGTEQGNPLFLFNLQWQEYINWNTQVERYELEYRNDIENWRNGGATSNLNMQNITDNYIWGGYWFRVNAYQLADSFASQSNWIYLIHQPEMWVPSAMSPNGDGHNDIWGVTPVYAKTYYMRVYNRYGEKVWETHNKLEQWPGTTNGKIKHDGVYAWYLEFTGWDDKLYRMKGTVSVIH